MKLKYVKIIICEACLEGMGDECHTPGCAFYLHNSLGFPVGHEMYEVIKEWEEEE